MKIIRIILAALLIAFTLQALFPAPARADEFDQEEHDTECGVKASAGAAQAVGQLLNLGDVTVYEVQFFLRHNGSCTPGSPPECRIIDPSDNSTIDFNYFPAFTSYSPTGEWISCEFEDGVEISGWTKFVFFNSWGTSTCYPVIGYNSESVSSGCLVKQWYTGQNWEEFWDADCAIKIIYSYGEYSNVPTVTTGTATLSEGGDNYTFQATLDDLGMTSGNVTTVGFEVALYGESYSANYTTSVNYSVPCSFEKVVDVSTLALAGGGYYKFRALAVSDIGVGYGLNNYFTFVQAPTVTTDGYSSSTIGGVAVYSLMASATSNSNLATRGINIGYAPEVWEDDLKLEEFAVGQPEYGGHWLNAQTGAETPFTDNSTSGTFSLTTSVLTANMTYYYQAYAGIYANGTWYYGYGVVRSFTTGAGAIQGYPVVTTNTAYLSPPDGTLVMSGTIVSSSTTIIERGFRYSLSSNMTGYSYTSDLANSFPLGYFAQSTDLSSYYSATGTVLYIQAFATNEVGNTGVGNIISYVIPELNVGPGGLVVTNTGATVNGNTATLRASIDNPGGITLERYGFAWGTTSGCHDGTFNAQISTGAVTISHIVTNLTTVYVYFYKAGVKTSSGNWYWSDPTTFTTGESLAVVTGSGPYVATEAATNIGTNSFTANGNLVSVGGTTGSYVSSRGFVYSLANQGQLDDWSFIGSSGNFSVGTYDQLITVSDTGGTVYYAAAATNQYATAYGKVFFVRMETTGGTSGTSGGSTNPATGAGSDQAVGFIKSWMASLGLDNTMGHWAFMGIIMMLEALGFGVGYMLVHEKLVRIVITITWGLIEIATVGAFLFSGLLGIVAAIALIFTCTGLVIIFGGRLLTFGRA